MFCINFDIDELLLLEKNKGPSELFPFVILEKTFWFLLLILLSNLRNLFIFCINVDVDEMLLLEKLGIYRLFPFVILEKAFWFLFLYC